jgi:glycosyltransferase involved in cell wall biosynthesis
MRILWIHQHFATPAGWGSTRPYEFTRRIAAMGHEIDVVCCAGYDPSLRHGAEVAPGVRVFVCRAAYDSKMGFARRVFSFLRFMLFAAAFALRRARNHDLILASSPPLTTAVPALAARRLRGARYVFEVVDAWPDAAVEAGVLKNPLLKRMAFWLEKRAYKDASAIVACSTGMAERVEKKMRGWDGRRRVETIPNGCDLDLSPWPRDPDGRAGLRAKGRATPRSLAVVYAGAMGVSNAIGDLVAAAEETAGDGRIVWWFAGDGRFAKDLKALAERQSNVVFWGAMTKASVAGLYAAADVNAVSFMHAPLFHENSPNKFFDGIAAGLPAVFNRGTWLEPWLKCHDCGFICETPQAMARTLREIASMPEARRAELSHTARRLAETVFNYDALAAKYLDVLAGV